MVPWTLYVMKTYKAFMTELDVAFMCYIQKSYKSFPNGRFDLLKLHGILERDNGIWTPWFLEICHTG